jgi:hypothetical protein
MKQQFRSETMMHGIGLPQIHHKVLGVYISRHRNMLVAEAFLKSLVKLYGKHTVYSDGWWNMGILKLVIL